MALKIGASMMCWVSLPKLRVTQAMDKWLNSMVSGAKKNAHGGLYGKMFSELEKRRLSGHRESLVPAFANQTSFPNRFKPLSHDKPF